MDPEHFANLDAAARRILPDLSESQRAELCQLLDRLARDVKEMFACELSPPKGQS